MTKHPKQACCKKKSRTNYTAKIQRFLNLQTCLFVLELDYVNIEIEAGLMPQPLFLDSILLQ